MNDGNYLNLVSLQQYKQQEKKKKEKKSRKKNMVASTLMSSFICVPALNVQKKGFNFVLSMKYIVVILWLVVSSK